jgi:hypothetical protein
MLDKGRVAEICEKEWLRLKMFKKQPTNPKQNLHGTILLVLNRNKR